MNNMFINILIFIGFIILGFIVHKMVARLFATANPVIGVAGYLASIALGIYIVVYGYSYSFSPQRVECPEGYHHCKYCDGKGKTASEEDCFVCKGKGYLYN